MGRGYSGGGRSSSSRSSSSRGSGSRSSSSRSYRSSSSGSYRSSSSRSYRGTSSSAGGSYDVGGDYNRYSDYIQLIMHSEALTDAQKNKAINYLNNKNNSMSMGGTIITGFFTVCMLAGMFVDSSSTAAAVLFVAGLVFGLAYIISIPRDKTIDPEIQGYIDIAQKEEADKRKKAYEEAKENG